MPHGQRTRRERSERYIQIATAAPSETSESVIAVRTQPVSTAPQPQPDHRRNAARGPSRATERSAHLGSASSPAAYDERTGEA